MSIVVVGCGRSGTNVALEILRGSPSLTASEPPEDKTFFQRTAPAPAGYLTKCDTCYFTTTQFDNMMTLDKNLTLVWTIRDPRDMALSKLYRGRARSAGGDCDSLADDATEAGCVADIKDMWMKFKYARSLYKRVCIAKMEDMINDPVGEAWALSRALRIAWNVEMPLFWQRMRNPQKALRYNHADKSQIGTHRHWRDLYGGHFERAGIDVEGIFEQLSEITEGLNYAP